LERKWMDKRKKWVAKNCCEQFAESVWENFVFVEWFDERSFVRELRP
jgi:hypothetical protein